MAVDLRDPEQLPGVSRATGLDLAARMSSLYGNAEQQLAEHIARNLRAGIESPSWALDKLLAVGQLNDWTKQLLHRLDGDARDEIRYSMLSAYLQGGTEATRALAAAQNTLPEWINKAGIDPGARIQGILNGKRSELEAGIARLTRAIPGLAGLQRMIGSLALRITGTHLPVLRWAEDAYRQTIAAAALPDVLLGTLTRRAASQKAWERLLGDGITGFTDKAGRPWNLATYVEMATRSGVAQAAVEGHLDRLTDAGIDLVIVSNAPQECKRCRPWEGKILARSGPSGRRTIQVEHATTGELIEVEIWGTVDDAVADGLLHPNCRHSLSAYLPGVTRIPTHTQDPDGDEARQKLRQLERETRKAKLQAAAVIDPAAKAPLEAKVRAKQAEIRQHVADTEHLGIFRKREREQPDLGNSAGLNAGRQTPAPKPTPASKATAKSEPKRAAAPKPTKDKASLAEVPITNRELAKIEARRDLTILKVQRKAAATEADLNRVDARIADAEERLRQTGTRYNWDAPHWDETAGSRLTSTPTPERLQTHIAQAVSPDLPEPLRTELIHELERQGERVPHSLLNLRKVNPLGEFDTDHENAWAYYQNTWRDISLHPERWRQSQAARGELAETWRQTLRAGWWSKTDAANPAESILGHEFGHHVAFRALAVDYTQMVKLAKAFDEGMSANGAILQEVRRTADFRAVVDAWLSSNHYRLKSQHQVSEYGLTNHQELMAEIWHEFTTARSPRAHISRMGQAMLEAAEQMGILRT